MTRRNFFMLSTASIAVYLMPYTAPQPRWDVLTHLRNIYNTHAKGTGIPPHFKLLVSPEVFNAYKREVRTMRKIGGPGNPHQDKALMFRTARVQPSGAFRGLDYGLIREGF